MGIFDRLRSALLGEATSELEALSLIYEGHAHEGKWPVR